jgi:hypothetical protein
MGEGPRGDGVTAGFRTKSCPSRKLSRMLILCDKLCEFWTFCPSPRFIPRLTPRVDSGPRGRNLYFAGGDALMAAYYHSTSNHTQ